MLQKLAKSHGIGSGGGSARASGLSVIGPDVRIVGDIITQGEMQIDGQVEGDITCQTLVVGEGARIAGEVSAETVRVHGELAGKINATTVVIAKSARVVGDVTHSTLEIEAGAHLEGHIIRKDGVTARLAIEAKPAEAKKANGAAQPQSQAEPAKPESAAAS